MASHEDKLAKLASLREQLASASGEPQFDRVHEEAKAKVRHRALLLLDQRARSRAELDTRLTRLEFDPGLIQDVLDDLERCGLVDDAVFATEWVRQRHVTRGKSRRALDQELVAKGVSADIRASALEIIAEDDEFDMAEEIAIKKARTIKSPPGDRREYEKLLARVVGVMARRGYSQSMCLTIGKRVLDRRIADLEDL